jgi:hypothetical protein
LVLLCVPATAAHPGTTTVGTVPVTSTATGTAPAEPGNVVESEAGGVHVRVVTPAGPVHLFRPAGYDRRKAGLVVYVHGYYVHVDDAWKQHKLATQFAASRRNALFIAIEAPAAPEDPSPAMSLRRLIASALRRAHVPAPAGSLIVIGHSAAYRTIVPWLGESALHNVILVDALYGNEPEFRAWLDKRMANRLTLIVKGTGKWADPFVRALPYAVRMSRIPKSIDQFSETQRKAKCLSVRSQYGHFELITDGVVLPILLVARTSLPKLTSRRPAAHGGARR